MYNKRALSIGQLAESGIDTSDYRFIETEGTFRAVLDLKVWGHKMLMNFLTLEDGRKIIACTFSLEKSLRQETGEKCEAPAAGRFGWGGFTCSW